MVDVGKAIRMGRRKTNEQFANEVYELVKDEYIFLEKYITSTEKIKCKHNLCGYEYSVAPASFLVGRRCPRCMGGVRKTNEEFVKEVYSLVGDEFTFLERYINDNTKIKCKHNKCGSEWYVTPSSFLKSRGCWECRGDAISKAKTKSHDEFKQEFYELVGDEYELLSEYKNARTKIRCKHSTCGYEWDVSPGHFLSGTRCPECHRPNYYRTIEQFTLQIFDLVGDEYTFLEDYIDVATAISCRHNDCGHIWGVQPNNFITGTRCPQCFGGIIKTDKQFKQEVFDIVKHEYTFIENYVNNRIPIKCRHNRCGHKWSISPSNFLRGNRCPSCAESKGEQAIRGVLSCKKVKFEQEYSFSGLLGVGGRDLRFDFAIFDDKNHLVFLIEYDGEFHYRQIFDGDSYETTQIHDERKNQYCKKNNIPLLRIPYWEFNRIESIIKSELDNKLLNVNRQIS